MEEALATTFESGKDIHVDLSGLLFIDAGGLRLLDTAAERLPRNRCLVLHAPPPHVQRMLNLARVDTNPGIIIRGAAPHD